jgi:hypothetical protein
MLAMLLEEEPRHSAYADAKPEANYASIAEGAAHLEFAKRLYVGVREAAGFDCGRRLGRHFVGNTGFETAYSEAMGVRGLIGNALESGQPQGFPAFPANRVSLEMVKNQSPRLTGAAFFCHIADGVEYDHRAHRLLFRLPCIHTDRPSRSASHQRAFVDHPCLAPRWRAGQNMQR